jgi:hypothetical protein
MEGRVSHVFSIWPSDRLRNCELSSLRRFRHQRLVFTVNNIYGHEIRTKQRIYSKLASLNWGSKRERSCCVQCWSKLSILCLLLSQRTLEWFSLALWERPDPRCVLFLWQGHIANAHLPQTYGMSLCVSNNIKSPKNQLEYTHWLRPSRCSAFSTKREFAHSTP